MKSNLRISLAPLLLLATTAATAQNAPSTVPQSPPPPTYPSSQQNQSPPPPRYPQAQPPVPAPAVQPAQPQWVHESSYADSNGFHYHPFRFHVDGGGTITQQTNETFIDNGWNAGAGLTWYPTSHLPLGIRLDGSYNEFRGRGALLDEASVAYQTRIRSATEKVWGGDADLELDIPFSPYVRLYLLAGGGWYKQQNTYRDRFFSDGGDCFPFGCGRFGGSGVVARTDTDWHFARNAGAGLEFAMGPRTSFFVEARYMRIDPNSAKNDFIPIRAGLRF